MRSMKLAWLVIAAAVAAGPALADRGGKHEKKDKRERAEREHERRGFDQSHREKVREYYAREMKRGHCPPGLKKMRNGCAPPGQAKRWKVGERLPRDVVYHDVPAQLKVEIGVPPSGYRYVQVANDILMIAAGTGMIVDAINDLGR
jgi:Ni/Co efflux regulator RcnB